MAHAIATWWDGVELWLIQLPFALQAMLVVAVVGAVCWGVAAVIDTVVERSVAARLAAIDRRRAASSEAAAGSTGSTAGSASESAPDGR